MSPQPAATVDPAGHSGDRQLVRAIGLWSAILFVVGSVIGSGIFLTTGVMAVTIPSVSLLLLAWTLGGALGVSSELGGSGSREATVRHRPTTFAPGHAGTSGPGAVRVSGTSEPSQDPRIGNSASGIIAVGVHSA